MIAILALILLHQDIRKDSSKANSKFINPNGTYRLGKNKTNKSGEIYGYFGEVRIKLIDSSKIAMSFYVCKGAPGYNSGSFIDTLDYNKNQSFYIPDDDKTCRLTFSFNKKGITVAQTQDNLNSGCGFGHGVFADGYYKRVSREVPEIIDLQQEDSDQKSVTRQINLNYPKRHTTSALHKPGWRINPDHL